MTYPELETVCRNICQDSKEILSWQWDSRFGGVLSQFFENSREVILPILTNHFHALWDNSNIDRAPAIIRKLSSDLGDLRENQLLFTTDPDADVLLLGAFWPWQDGRTVSLRILPKAPNLPDSQRQDFSAAFKSWFGI